MGLQIDPQRTRYAIFVISLVVFVIILFLIAPLVWSVLQIFILAALITLALEAPVRWQVMRGVPRWAATLNLLLLLLVVGLAFFSFFLPQVIQQTRQLIVAAPAIWETLSVSITQFLQRYPAVADVIDLPRFMQDLFSSAGSWGSAVRSVFATALGAVTATILIIATVIYTLLNPWPLLFGLRGLFPTDWWGMLERIARLVAERVRAWVIGTLVLAIVIGTLDYLALWLINLFFPQKIPFILFFALLGGALEIVPFIGPFIATVLPALVGFTISPMLGIMVVLAFFIIQQLEANLLTPLIMHRAMKLHQVTLLFMLVILSGLFGLFGAIIAVPVSATLKILYDEWYYPLTHQGKRPLKPHGDPPHEKQA